MISPGSVPHCFKCTVIMYSSMYHSPRAFLCFSISVSLRNTSIFLMCLPMLFLPSDFAPLCFVFPLGFEISIILLFFEISITLLLLLLASIIVLVPSRFERIVCLLSYAKDFSEKNTGKKLLIF